MAGNSSPCCMPPLSHPSEERVSVPASQQNSWESHWLDRLSSRAHLLNNPWASCGVKGVSTHIWLSRGHVLHFSNWSCNKHDRNSENLNGNHKSLERVIGHRSREASKKKKKMCLLKPQLKMVRLALSWDSQWRRALGTLWEAQCVGPSHLSLYTALGLHVGRPLSLFLVRSLSNQRTEHVGSYSAPYFCKGTKPEGWLWAQLWL